MGRSRMERCVGAYLVRFGESARCELPKGHTGGHAPAGHVTQRPAPAVQGSDTSEAAARRLDPNKRLADKEAVFTVIARSSSGLTDEEIATVLGLDGNTARPRRIELIAESRITEATRRRPTRSGRLAKVWVKV